MIDYSIIIQSKYFDFFTSEESKTVVLPNAIMDDFFDNMRMTVHLFVQKMDVT